VLSATIARKFPYDASPLIHYSPTEGQPMSEEPDGDFIEDSLALAPEPYKSIIRKRLEDGVFGALLEEMRSRYSLTEDQIDTITLITFRAACDPDVVDSLKDGLIAEADVSYETAVKLKRDIVRDVILPIKTEGDAVGTGQGRAAVAGDSRTLSDKDGTDILEFPELYKKFLEIYWDGDINNARELDDDARDAHQSAVDSDIDRLEDIYSFATTRSMKLFGRMDHVYDHEDGRTVYLEKVFIVDEGTNVLRFEFEGRISYPLGATLPCEPGGTYLFSGRIGYAEYYWSYMNPRHMYSDFGFRNDVTFLCLEISLKEATCVSAGEIVYTGRSFGLPSGERFRQHRPSASKKDEIESTPKGGCFIATAAYGSSLASEVVLLSRFRDDVLLRSKLGALFVTFYYQVSPPLASFIAQVEFLRAATRRLFLSPLLKLLKRS
jgi:hypothetical protein